MLLDMGIFLNFVGWGGVGEEIWNDLGRISVKLSVLIVLK